MRNVIIVGAGIAGALLKEDVAANHPDINIIGFVDDAHSPEAGKFLGRIDQLPSILRIYKIDEIIVALPSAGGELMRKILLHLLDNRIPLKLIPRTQEVISRDFVTYANVKDFSCEDFLGRAFRKSETSVLQSFYQDKTVLVTGGAGSIGSEMVRQLLDLDVRQVVVYDNSEFAIFNLNQMLLERDIPAERCKCIVGSVVNRRKMDRVVGQEKPDVIFHAAAYKHVYLMEDNVDEAIVNNVIGVKNVVDAAVAHGIGDFVFISTDKVVNPTGVMGASKKLGEFYLRQFVNCKTKFNIVRFGNVINSNGSVLPLFERQLKTRRRLTVTDRRVKRFFMSIREAAQLVISCLIHRSGGEIFILNMGELIGIYEIAQCLVRSRNLIVDEDVKMDVIGLKKGEKMEEELFTEAEMQNMEATAMKDVYRLKNHDECHMDVEAIISELTRLVEEDAPQAKTREYLMGVFR
ncbi:MAG: polysaccharide biosynthesis protein [Holosporaceae bacterium]|jgi:FlaA1/EpsC-like NDP-sugar epimerase|nr:polysaccharide biosynthesis protein [Holosporaceae bacterium]